MTNGLGLAVIPGAGWTASDIRTISREAEDAGFDSIFTTEVNNDALATAQLMGSATRHIRVGTWTANIYLRHPYVCAQGAALIAEATNGRFMLGLGVSHQPVNAALAIDMAKPSDDIRTYVDSVRNWLRGEGPPTHLPQQPARISVPIYVAALTSRTVEQAAERADGIMPIFWSPDRVKSSRSWCNRGRARAGQREPLIVTLGIPTFVGNDVEQQREIARQSLGLYTFFPFFQRLFRASGFAHEADQMERRAGPSALSDALLDSICLLGSIEHCRERLAEYRQAGVDLPILMAPIGVDGARAVIDAFSIETDVRPGRTLAGTTS
ncbi:MAG: LLM class flavin-dependent oxidoreductase [Chloroflexi bacterium]|nr:LLM class flavin-dependent oxidoreductase [Chloroflexota bacterium]MBV9597620.1 LLM class flavin-dependent oxidoreductase [Chloroflexota bacterium]